MVYTFWHVNFCVCILLIIPNLLPVYATTNDHFFYSTELLAHTNIPISDKIRGSDLSICYKTVLNFLSNCCEDGECHK